MGPGVLVKALLQGGFSLMVFGWAQVVMDVQPLLMIVTGDGQLNYLLWPEAVVPIATGSSLWW